MVSSERLASLKLSLTKFDALESVLDDWRATNLTTFELHSCALYIAAFEQFKYTAVVAQICTKFAASLQQINIPSSVMVKHFCVHFISNGIKLPALQKLSVNGLADTKMFLSPGNKVESRFYREFLTLCPQIESLSLHSFSGSLASLPLPLSLTQLTLPWDNRLNLSEQTAAILSTISMLPNLQSLSIAGVEEVEGVVLDVSSQALHARTGPFLEIDSLTLTEFRISNAYIGGIDLRGCSSLKGFALHYCPLIKELNLPTSSLQDVRIYDNYRPFIDKFLIEFSTAKDHPSSCFINLQVHSIGPASVEVVRTPTETSAKLYEKAVGLFAASESDYCILKRLGVRELEHNSGEPLFPCTEFHTNNCLFNRSYEQIIFEKHHHNFVMDGLHRWQDALSQVKSLISPTITSTSHALPAKESTMLFCGAGFQCCSNNPHFFKLNSSPDFVQPSGSVEQSEKEKALKVPRLEAPPMANYLVTASSTGLPVSGSPLVVVSILEYMHNVHTLFYY